MDRGAAASDRRALGFSCELSVDPPGHTCGDFAHDCDETITVVDGRLAFTVDAERLEAGAGDETNMRRRGAHTVWNIAPGMMYRLFGCGR